MGKFREDFKIVDNNTLVMGESKALVSAASIKILDILSRSSPFVFKNTKNTFKISAALVDREGKIQFPDDASIESKIPGADRIRIRGTINQLRNSMGPSTMYSIDYIIIPVRSELKKQLRVD